MGLRTAALVGVATTAILLAPTAADGASSLSRKVATTLRIAKAADRKATQALRAKAIPGQGGLNGAPGSPGVTGTNGASGGTGSTGAAGTDGKDGATGTADLDLVSATNANTVTVNENTEVVTLSFERTKPGTVLVSAEGQVNGETTTKDGVLCEVRVDSATRTQRYVAVPGLGQVSITATVPVSLDTGQHSAAFVCRKQSSNSQVDFPGERTRLTVLGG